MGVDRSRMFICKRQASVCILCTRSPHSIQKSLASSSTNSGFTKTFGGDPLPFNDWISLARDPSGQFMYVYEGIRPNSQTSNFDFDRLDFEMKSWTNLAVRFPIPFTSAAAPIQNEILFFRTLCCIWTPGSLIPVGQKRRLSPSSITHPVLFSQPTTSNL